MNGVLTKGGKKYFMTLIDDCTRFCYVYLLKTNDEALYYFKIYKLKKRTNLRRKSSGYGLIMRENTSHMSLLNSTRNMELFMRTPPYSPQPNGIPERNKEPHSN
jgi:hypothetical protein